MKKTLGKMLADARAARGFTLRGLESHTGISNPMLSQIETGHVPTPSFRNVVKIARILDIPLDDLAATVK